MTKSTLLLDELRKALNCKSYKKKCPYTATACDGEKTYTVPPHLRATVALYHRRKQEALALTRSTGRDANGHGFRSTLLADAVENPLHQALCASHPNSQLVEMHGIRYWAKWRYSFT